MGSNLVEDLLDYVPSNLTSLAIPFRRGISPSDSSSSSSSNSSSSSSGSGGSKGNGAEELVFVDVVLEGREDIPVLGLIDLSLPFSMTNWRTLEALGIGRESERIATVDFEPLNEGHAVHRSQRVVLEGGYVGVMMMMVFGTATTPPPTNTTTTLVVVMMMMVLLLLRWR